MENNLQESPKCMRNAEQHFLVTVSVHKARHLNILNCDTFVMVSLDGKYKQTQISYRTENPYFNEFFSFELHCSEKDLLRKNIHFTLYRSSACASLNSAVGEFTVDLRTVWEQQYHAFLKKWAAFEPIGRAASNELRYGYLMVDIAVASSLETPFPVVFDDFDYDDIKNNRMLPYESNNAPQRVRYCCNIFGGDFVGSNEYVVCVSFAGSTLRTKPSAYGRTHRWNEKLSFIGSFPSLNQTFIVQLLTVSCCYRSVKFTQEFHFSSICMQTEGINQLPTYGPSMVYFYTGAQDSRYVGKTLLSISTDVLPVLTIPARKVQTDRIYEPMMMASNYWEEETFEVLFYLINFERFALPHAKQIMLYLTCADFRSKATTITLDRKNTAFGASYVTAPNESLRQLTMKIETPDYRHKYFITSAVHGLLAELQQLVDLLTLLDNRKEGEISESQQQLICFCTANVEVAFDSAQETIRNGIYRKHTKWDDMRKAHALQQLEHHKTYFTALKAQAISGIESTDIIRLLTEFNHIKTAIAHVGQDVGHIKEQNRYPEVLLHVSRPGHASVEALCRFDMADYLLPANTGTPPGGLFAARRCTILPRSISCNHSCPGRCGCIYGKLDFVMVIGTDDCQVHVAPHGTTSVGDFPARNEPIVWPGGCTSTSSCQVDCKVHVHQGRIYSGFDGTDLVNAKLTVSFETYEMSSSTKTQTLTPCWNETIELKNVPFIESTDARANQQEQRCTITCMLQDENNKTTMIGIGWLDSTVFDCTAQQLSVESNANALSVNHQLRTALRWVPFYNKGICVAEILMSSDIAKVVSRINQTYVERLVTTGLPQEIVPQMSFYKMEVHMVGLRQLCVKMCRRVKISRVMITVGEVSLSSSLSDVSNRGSANFPEECLTCSLYLPQSIYYWPSIVITHLDYTDINRFKTVGLALISAEEISIEHRPQLRPINSTIINLSEDDEAPLPQALFPIQFSENVLNNWANIGTAMQVPFQNLRQLKIDASAKRQSNDNDELSWWTSFYNSLLPNDDHAHTLKIYDKQLEQIPEFNGFKDWSGSYALGYVKRSKELLEKPSIYGAIKCKISVTPITRKESPVTGPAIFSDSTAPRKPEPVEVTVVVYVVQALNLASRDISSESDAYIVLTFGNECVRDRAYYIPNQASPVFGRRFEMRGVLPRDQMLHLSIYDRDFASPDDLIGSTCVDIEDRFRSRHLPVYGLPQRFSSSGYNRWRHARKPSEILMALCTQYALGQPTFTGRDRIRVAGVEFASDNLDPDECATEQLCLLALNRFGQLPGGFPLTPEHVETRSLYHPKRLGIEQGKVQLWVEVYEPGVPHPEPLDITPQPPKPYELRVIVWNTADVVLNERNIFGTRMSDIYVKCWLQEFAKAQRTDVHYRSLTGEGNFNWRMVFPFRFSPPDGMLVVRRKKAFYEQYDTEAKFPPVLTVQIWDNDAFSADDFLGTLELNLTRLPAPARAPERCVGAARSLSLTGGSGSTGHGNGLLNLFRRRRVRGWFPVHGNREASYQSGKTARGHSQKRNSLMLTGKIELELEIVSEEDAAQTPVGRGREPPQHLPEPLRPEVSFNWLQQPARTFNKLLWPRIRRSFAWVGAALLLCLLLYGLVVNLPTVFMVRTLDQRKSSTAWSETSVRSDG